MFILTIKSWPNPKMYLPPAVSSSLCYHKVSHSAYFEFPALALDFIRLGFHYGLTYDNAR